MGKLNQAMTDLLRYNAAILPQKRSAFSKNHSHTTTFDSGFLVPIMWDRVLPGDEKKIRYSGLARMATPIHPVMDEAYLDTWAFFVPDRLWWNHAKEFYGENKDASFNPDGEYVMPYLKPSQYYVRKDASWSVDPIHGVGSLNDYFGFPCGDNGAGFIENEIDDKPEAFASAGLHRCYQLIWNEYYRNASIIPALTLNDGDTVTSAEWNVISQIRLVCKLPDMFTTLLKEPQAGSDVLLPLGDWAPVVTRDTSHDPTDPRFGKDPLEWYAVDSDGVVASPVGTLGDNYIAQYEGQTFIANQTSIEAADNEYKLVPANLWADLTSATASTINNLRAAITVQQLLEIDAIGGKRYQQIIQAHFGVFTPDATLQRPELLGATRTPIGMRQVLQTSATEAGVSPQGNTAAVSVTNVANEWICNKAFTEPGFIMVLACVRPIHSYSQGLNCLLTKLQRYDHYWPVFDNLGNQPVYKSEIYADMFPGDSSDTYGSAFREVFGYKEAWQEYRMLANRVSGLMRPDVTGTLASWNYSSNFAGPMSLNYNFVIEDPALIDRTIAVKTEPQFLLDSYFEYLDIKNMSVHSVPGLTRL